MEADVKPDNFVKVETGDIIPIDPVIVQVMPGSPLDQAVQANIKAE